MAADSCRTMPTNDFHERPWEENERAARCHTLNHRRLERLDQGIPPYSSRAASGAPSQKTDERRHWASLANSTAGFGTCRAHEAFGTSGCLRFIHCTPPRGSARGSRQTGLGSRSRESRGSRQVAGAARSRRSRKIASLGDEEVRPGQLRHIIGPAKVDRRLYQTWLVRSGDRHQTGQKFIIWGTKNS